MQSRYIARTRKHEHSVVVSTLVADPRGLQPVTSTVMGWYQRDGDVFWRGACPTCAKVIWVAAYRVSGKHSDSRECDPRCTGASGHSCECSCSGKNHGADFAD